MAQVELLAIEFRILGRKTFVPTMKPNTLWPMHFYEKLKNVEQAKVSSWWFRSCLRLRACAILTYRADFCIGAAAACDRIHLLWTYLRWATALTRSVLTRRVSWDSILHRSEDKTDCCWSEYKTELWLVVDEAFGRIDLIWFWLSRM